VMARTPGTIRVRAEIEFKERPLRRARVSPDEATGS
jgi:hypothetical protein